jgi:hypothetical protein
MGGFREAHHLSGFILRDMHTKFHDDRFGHSSNVKGITSTIWEAAVLVLLMERMYEIYRLDDLRCHDIHIKSHDDRFSV